MLMISCGQVLEIAAQTIIKSESLLNKLEIKLYPAGKIKLENPISKFRYQKVNAKLENLISADIIFQLKRQGYYLPAVDSLVFYPGENQAGGKLLMHVSPGIQFILNRVDWNIADSLDSLYNEQILDITSDYLEKAYTENRQNQMFSDILMLFENSGYPLAKILTKNFFMDSVSVERMGINLLIDIDPGEKITISGLKLPEKSDIDESYLERSKVEKKG